MSERDSAPLNISYNCMRDFTLEDSIFCRESISMVLDCMVIHLLFKYCTVYVDTYIFAILTNSLN